MNSEHSPRPSRGVARRLAKVMIAACVLALLAVIFMPALSRSREAARREHQDSGSTQAPRTHGGYENVGRYLITDINNAGGSALRTARQYPRQGQAVSVTPLPENRPVALEPLRYFGPSYPGGEVYEHQKENPYRLVMREPLSTFSIDVDTASYANVRRFLSQHQHPPRDAVRIEELINYFEYQYAEPSRDEPFSVTVDVAEYPSNATHWLARIGLKGPEAPEIGRGAANLVFLLDVSGSMQPSNKLPLIQQSMRYLVRQLQPNDRVAIVTYAGTSQVALDSTPVGEANAILAAIDSLTAQGSTNGSAGIRDAYAIARSNFVRGGINRVILATDGDFNVGVTNRNDLMTLIQDEAKTNVFLTVLGFGMGNYKDANLETIADRGNGTYHYVDNFREARKVFGKDLTSNLVTIAKDVKIQVEFNPARVQAYRLIGYENRVMAARDFNDDTKDAGEIGSGHTVTALYELIPAGVEVGGNVDPLRYSSTPSPKVPEVDPTYAGELMTVKLRYKAPEADRSRRLEIHVPDAVKPLDDTSADFRFAASVAMYGMLLRHSPEAGDFTYSDVLALAEPGLDADPHGYRAEYVDLVRKTMEMTPARRR